jgi:hypothetical protein
MPVRKVCTLLGLAFVTTALDPYTYGATGGDVWYPRIAWQLIGGVSQLILLAAAGFALWRGRFSLVATIIVGEAVLFAVGSVVLIVRDGIDRLVIGYDALPVLLLLLIVGAVSRYLLIVFVIRSDLRTGSGAT